jgi:hypothetical protein
MPEKKKIVQIGLDIHELHSIRGLTTKRGKRNFQQIKLSHTGQR